MSLTTAHYRFNVFPNGSYPNGGKALMFNMSANSDSRNAALQDFYKAIESLFYPNHADNNNNNNNNNKHVYRVFTEKGGEITHVNQLFNDDILIFTTAEQETFLPLDFSIVSKPCNEQKQHHQQQDLFTVHTKWLSNNSSELMEIMSFPMTKFDATVSTLRRMIPMQVKKEALSNFNVAEFVVIYRGVELSDAQNLFTLYQQQVQEQQQRNEPLSPFTVFLVKKPFSIRIVTPSSRRITLTLECADAPETTIGQLKEMIYEQEQSMPCSKMKLYNTSSQLISNDSTTLRDIGLLGTIDRVLHLKYSVF